jgi:hypothetical protein
VTAFDWSPVTLKISSPVSELGNIARIKYCHGIPHSVHIRQAVAAFNYRVLHPVARNINCK